MNEENTQPITDTATESTESISTNSVASADNLEVEAQIEARLREKYEADKQREIDKRVTEAVKKREAKYKLDQVAKDRQAKLSEEEKIRDIQADRERELEARHRELVGKELKLDLVDILTENKLPLEFREILDVSKYIDLDADTRVEELKKDLVIFKDKFDSIIENKVAEIKKEYLKGNSPVSSDKPNVSLSAYDKARKTGDVKAMLNAKLYGDK